jgi:hypothetical protein
MNSITQLSKEEAARCYECGHYLNWSDTLRAEFQLQQEHLCMPFNVYQKALEASLGRLIATHELGDRNRLIAKLSRVPVKELAQAPAVSSRTTTTLNKSTNPIQ